ncbi:MAG: metallophosphoesterase family protein [Solirubrobacterales bacterium]
MGATRESTRATAIPTAARLADDADWSAQPADLTQVGTPLKRFSWLSPRTLWRSRNNVLASLTGDPTENARAAWVHAQEATHDGDFTIRRDDLDDFSFMVLGDTGEGDRSQYSVVPAFLNVASGSEFAVIASDVVYPAGDVNEYVGKFFIPFADYPRPIYAIPGNHDWLDGLVGFMRHFCNAAPPAEKFRPPRRARWSRLTLVLHQVFWRRPRALDTRTLALGEELRGEARASGPAQPNMYFCIDTPELRVIAIDVGILGRLDHAQGEWLARVSAGPKPKLLVSGKPVYSGANMSPRRILAPDGSDGTGSLLWSLVRDPTNNFVAMISGDVHHYERHSVRVGDGREIQCIISGGGGAFMTSTHQLPKVDRPDVDERSWLVYPTRADSLRAYSIILLRKLQRLTPWRRGRPVRGIPADEAAAIVSARHGLDLGAELARGEGAGEASAIKVSRRSRLLATLIYPLRGWFAAEKISEALDWDDPPFFKNFVRVDATAGRVTLTAYGVTGLARDVAEPTVIDRLEIDTGVNDGSR